jgi:signal transduction histidine kinase
MLDVALKQRQEMLEQIMPEVSTPIDGKVAHYLEILRKECERESQLINDLLDLQRLDADSQPIDLKTLELQDWLPQLVEVFRERANNRQQFLLLDVSSDLPPIVTNVPGLERMLAELLNNACKYTPAEGEIRVTVRLRSGRIKLEVSNSGVEIPARELPRVFDKFYRVPSNDPWKQGGTGLGLALVRKLAQHLGGDIEADSGNSRTWFTVDMPMVMELRPYAVEAAH